MARTVRIISLAPSVDRFPSQTLRARQVPCKPRNGQEYSHSDKEWGLLLPLEGEPLFRRRRRRLGRRPLPAERYREPATNHVENRRENEPERGYPDHAGEHGGAERLSQLGSRAD